MKKILIAITALLALLTMSYATGYNPPECETCIDGVDGKDGLNGLDGVDGKDGLNGLDGVDGKDGLNGLDGKDGVVNYSFLKNVYNRIAESNAGSASMAVIDFGSVCKGETAGGLGLGAGDTGAESKYAVGAGVKHGLTDDTAVVAKGYYGLGGHANAVGLGVVHKF